MNTDNKNIERYIIHGYEQVERDDDEGDFIKYSDYQAAHAASEKRIAELEEEKQNLRGANIDCNNWFDALKIDFDKLQADNKRLVEAVTAFVKRMYIISDREPNAEKDKEESGAAFRKLEQALYPTESLEDE